MEKKFTINGSTTEIKYITEQQYDELKNMILALPQVEKTVILIEDTNFPEVNEEFSVSANSDITEINNFINNLPTQTVNQPPVPQETIESILLEYELLPTTPEEQTMMETNQNEFLKTQINTLETEDMYYFFKRAMHVLGETELWETKINSIAHLLDYSEENMAVIPWSPYTDAYREALYAIICEVIDSDN